MMARQTPLFSWHERHGGRMVNFSGWILPVNYSSGILSEHLACRKFGGLFDISHMGRFGIQGPGALKLLMSALTNDASRLRPGQAQYTLFSDDQGRPLDDAYLYRFKSQEYLLVVNAANREKDWSILASLAGPGVDLLDLTLKSAMIAVQGPQSQSLVGTLLNQGLPPPGQGRTAVTHWQGEEVLIARTGYTGETLGFELFLPVKENEAFWQCLIEAGAPLGIIPCGLGARDTLRLEAGLPLYGHELQGDRPILSLPLARKGVDLNPERGDFRGRKALSDQIKDLGSPAGDNVPRQIRALEGEDKGMIRQGSPVLVEGKEVGKLTSGTMVPAWKFIGQEPGTETFTRTIGLAYLDRGLTQGEKLVIQYRGRHLQGRIVNTFVQKVGNYLCPVSA